jgi:oligo-alginate lyase
LRNDPSLIVRRKDKGSTLFANALEIHGTYSTVTEAPIGSTSLLKSLTVLVDTASYSAVRIDFTNGEPIHLVIANQDNNDTTQHTLETDGRLFQWKGPYLIN